MKGTAENKQYELAKQRNAEFARQKQQAKALVEKVKAEEAKMPKKHGVMPKKKAFKKMIHAEKKEIKKEVRREVGKAAGVPVSYARGVANLGRPIRGLGRSSRGQFGRAGARTGRGSTYKRYTFSGSDMVIPSLTATGVVGQVIAQLYVSPTQLPTPRLNILAQLYERFQFRKLSFRYIPSVPTSAPGTITMHYDNDANDALSNTTAGTNIQLAMSHKKAIEVPVFREKRMSVRPTLLDENEYWVDASGAVSRQSTQGIFCVLNGPGLVAASAGYVSALGSIVLDWTIDFWVEVTESASAATGANVGCEFYARSGSILSAANFNTLAPMDTRYDGPGSVNFGAPIVPDIGTCPGVVFNMSSVGGGTNNSLNIVGTQAGTYVFMQIFNITGPDTLGGANNTAYTAASIAGYSAVTQNVNSIQGGTATNLITLYIFTSSTVNWGVNLRYPSIAACTISTTSGEKWRRSFLFKVAGYTSPHKKTDSDLLKESVLTEVLKSLGVKPGLDPKNPREVREEKDRVPSWDEKDYVDVDRRGADAAYRPPPLKPVRTPGRQGGPNTEDIKIPYVPLVSPSREGETRALLAEHDAEEGLARAVELFADNQQAGDQLAQTTKQYKKAKQS